MKGQLVRHAKLSRLAVDRTAMRLTPRPIVQDGVVVIGHRPRPLRDLYHAALRATWPATIGVIVVSFLLANLLFAVGYWLVGGVAHAREDSLVDAFFFSVQTMGTIGYGAMYPESLAAHLLVVAESVVGLLITALATGLVFAKFSQPTSRIAFSSHAVIFPINGVPTLSVRVGNERENTISEATVRMLMLRTERTDEGMLFYRMHDLKLERERSPAIRRSWTVLHTIDSASPLHGYTPERAAKDEVEIVVTIVGTDDISMQPVHGRNRYLDTQVVWGARHADVLTELPDGLIQLDVRKFHDLVATEPNEAFPHRWDGVLTRPGAP